MTQERQQLDVSVGQELKEINSRLQSLREEIIKKQESTPAIPLIDPTANIIALMSASNLRQDDLRKAENRRVDDILCLQVKLDTQLQSAREASHNSLAAAESKRIDAITLAESRRLDALLAAATTNVSLAAEKASAQAATLAAQVASSAEALRNQVATTALTTSTLITQVRESLEKRLTSLEQNQYQGVGVTMQRTEGRQQNQWVIGLIASLALGMGALIMRLYLK